MVAPEHGLEVLDEASVIAIHQGTLEILEHVGVIFNNTEANSIFNESSGARVDGDHVFLSESLVMRSIKRCPSKVILRARDPKKSVMLGTGEVYYSL